MQHPDTSLKIRMGRPESVKSARRLAVAALAALGVMLLVAIFVAWNPFCAFRDREHRVLLGVCAAGFVILCLVSEPDKRRSAEPGVARASARDVGSGSA
jgi:hypothetical protein